MIQQVLSHVFTELLAVWLVLAVQFQKRGATGCHDHHGSYLPLQQDFVQYGTQASRWLSPQSSMLASPCGWPSRQASRGARSLHSWKGISGVRALSSAMTEALNRPGKPCV